MSYQRAIELIGVVARQVVGGRYFEDCNEAALDENGSGRGVAPHAVDPEAAARLWDVSVATLTA
jgi:hypothetical protein